MENVLTVVNGVAWFMGALGSAVAVFYVAYSGYLFITGQGDPQRMAPARSSLIGVAVGLVVIGGAFIIPGTISRFIIEPAGGVPIEPRAGFDCDGLLKDQLVFQRAASTAARMNTVISQVQSQHSACGSDVWNPRVVDMEIGSVGQCFDSDAGTQGPSDAKVGDSSIPEGLKIGGGTGKVRLASGRDSDNNIIVYWDDTEAERPSDGASCWLYFARLRTWHENYYN